ncbi:MAG: DUF1569 domain-containing protein [Gemmatimonadota bacterium]
MPRAPVKWSPSQVVEHVARILDESANVAAGAPSKFPNMPFLIRPIIRSLMFRRILKKNAFPNLKAIKPLDPLSGSTVPAAARIRLQGALSGFDQAGRARDASGESLASSLFGAVSPTEFAKFQELHIRHHLLQMPGPA